MSSVYNIHSAWVLMLLLTASTYGFGKSGLGGFAVVCFLLATVVIKGTVIIRDFMELRGVSLAWRVIMHGWLWTICLTIFITYIISLK